MVIEPTLLCTPQALLLGRFTGAKTWLHIQDLEVDAAFRLGILKLSFIERSIFWIESKLMRRFDKVSTISNAMIERLKSKNLSSSKIILFPNWVDTDEIFPDRSKLGEFKNELDLPSQCTVALYSGNLGEKQGLDIIIDAADSLKHVDDLFFIVCGEGSAKGRLMDKSQHLTNIRFIPLQPVTRLNELLNLADIHLLPQRADAADLVMPSKLTGILACGGPVIATAELGTELAKAVQEAGGLISPPGDVERFINNILELSKDAQRLDSIRQKARTYALEHLGKKSILKHLEDYLLDLRSNPRSPKKNRKR